MFVRLLTEGLFALTFASVRLHLVSALAISEGLLPVGYSWSRVCKLGL